MSDEILCEVNGIPVLCRDADGDLYAPEGLEGVAAYFEARGVPDPVRDEELWWALEQINPGERPPDPTGDREAERAESEWEDWRDAYLILCDRLLDKGGEGFPVEAEYKDCHGDWHEVQVVGTVPASDYGDMPRYIVSIPQEEHGVLVAMDKTGREWWDGDSVIVGASNVRFDENGN